jgi:hypothetical protein
VADLTRKGLTWQINCLLASPIKPVLALNAKTGGFHREPDFLGQGITVKGQFTNFPAECQCQSDESVHLIVKRRIGGRSTCCHGNTLLIYLSCRLKAFRQNFTYFVFTSKIKGFADTSALNARG